MIRSRLYVKMYLTILCGLLLVVLSLGTFAMLADDDDGFSSKKDKVAAALLGPDVPAAQRQLIMDRLADKLDVDIAIFDRNDKFVQGAGALTSEAATSAYMKDRPRRWHEFDADLPDGGRIVIYMETRFDQSKGPFLVAIFIVAVAIGIAALPAVRYLTRRLEELRKGVEHWGEGALSSRIEVCGQDEIAMVAQSFNKAADRVENLITSQKSLLANASHELRSPLARLRMAAEMFEASPSDTLREEIVRNLTELDELVDEILLKSRLDSNQKPEFDQLVDLLPLAAEEAAAAGAEVDGEPLTVPGNERLLRRVIRNLVQNAARHGKPPVTVYVRTQAGLAHVVVCDHGDGIKTEEASRVFEPFYRPEGRSESAGGWGLGLALVAEIARLHGGKAWYTPLDGGGACFTVELPMSRPSGPEA